jgi:hypothetical protein
MLIFPVILLQGFRFKGEDIACGGGSLRMLSATVFLKGKKACFLPVIFYL